MLSHEAASRYRCRPGGRQLTGQGGVRVDMLKPDAVLRDERVRVAEIGDVFSGGQLLAAAIMGTS
jgi:hypothetical protein